MSARHYLIVLQDLDIHNIEQPNNFAFAAPLVSRLAIDRSSPCLKWKDHTKISSESLFCIILLLHSLPEKKDLNENYLLWIPSINIRIICRWYRHIVYQVTIIRLFHAMERNAFATAKAVTCRDRGAFPFLHNYFQTVHKQKILVSAPLKHLYLIFFLFLSLFKFSELISQALILKKHKKTYPYPVCKFEYQIQSKFC